MRFFSTAGDPVGVTVSEAIIQGLAADGGLFVPERFPRFEPVDFGLLEMLAPIGETLLRPFFAGDPLQVELPAVCSEAFDFPVPLRPLPVEGGELAVLELFHGPTAAFKDVGARFLAACLQRLEAGGDRPLLILVATSGDTGGAVAAAFHQRPGVEVAILYPEGMVSPRQEQQLTCWGDNVRAFRVAGTFDDCQRLVKQAMRDPALRRHHRLSSANSINIGRLLPQCVYYAAASLWHWRDRGDRVSFIVPTGNLGNALACIWTRAMGLPIDRVVVATNANRAIPDYLDSGEWRARETIATLASAMDVGNPSNMERLSRLFPDVEALRGAITSLSVDDEAIRDQIRRDHERSGEVWCPHTATALHAWRRLGEAGRAGHAWIAVATAHAAKFEGIIEPIIGEAVAVPQALARLLDRPSAAVSMPPDLDELRAHLVGRERP